MVPDAGGRAARRPIASHMARGCRIAPLPADAHMQNRRIIDGVFRSVGAKPVPAVETNSIFNLVSHVSAGQWSAIVPRQLLRFFGVPAGTQAIELVGPGGPTHDRPRDERPRAPSPLARNLFAMQLPANVAALIQPPDRFETDEGAAS